MKWTINAYGEKSKFLGTRVVDSIELLKLVDKVGDLL